MKQPKTIRKAVCLLIAVLMLTVSLVSCGQEYLPPAGMKSVMDPSYSDFNVSIPEDWECTVSTGAFGASAVVAEGKIPAVISIVRVYTQKTNLEDYWNEMKGQYGALYKDFTFDTHKETQNGEIKEYATKAVADLTMDGHTGFVVSCRGVRNDVSYEIRYCYIISGLYVYVCTYSAPAAEFADYEADFAAILGSFSTK